MRDNVIATRFDLTEKGYKLITRSYLPDLQQAAALIDLPDENFGSVDLYVICAHFKAGVDMGDILLRTRQGDAIAAHIGDAVTPGGEFDLPGGPPIIVLGDFNIYSTDPRDTKCYGVGNGAVRRQPRRGSYRRA
ncbi:MAG: endonuclease/exonuclease/phosphatase family protein [Anaerolineales bacterium]